MDGWEVDDGGVAAFANLITLQGNLAYPPLPTLRFRRFDRDLESFSVHRFRKFTLTHAL